MHMRLVCRPCLAKWTLWLKDGDRVLDVGCGAGKLGQQLMSKRPGLLVEGLEKFPRGNEPIRVYAYDGDRFPFDDGAYDVAIVADVLHHDDNPLKVLGECRRVAKRYVVVKDHLVSGAFSYMRISLLDWAANMPYGVRCLYKYWTLDEWKAMFEEAGLSIILVRTSMRLYHPVLDVVFGGGLHLLALTQPVTVAPDARGL